MCPDVSLADWQEPRWYVLFVRSNQEKRVASHLQDRGIEHFLACYESLRQWKDRRVKLQRPLFPGYIFVHLPLLKRDKALTIPNVLSLVGKKHAPATISGNEIVWIRHCIKNGLAEPHDYLDLGERVVITEGALAGMEGVLLERRNGARLVVALGSIARAFAVEVDATWVKAVRSLHTHSANSPAGFPATRESTDKRGQAPSGVGNPDILSAVHSAERLSSGHGPFEGHGGF